MRMLVVTWDGGGNLPPMLGIARALADRGDRVRVLGHRIQREAIESTGLPFSPIEIGRDYVSAQPRGTVDGDVVATTGAVDPAALRAPSNARVVRHVDHSELLGSTSLVIGHGGHATTARALGAGIPVLVMPMHPLMDQPAVRKAVTRLGVGTMLAKTASVEKIRDAVRRLLADDEIRAAARGMGAETRAKDGAQVAVEAVRSLARA